MKHTYTFEYKRIKLRPLEEADIEKLRILRNQLKEYFFSQTEITPEMQHEWYANYLEKNNDIMFAIESIAQPGVFIGAIALYDIKWEELTCECGRTVVNKELAPEKGIGMEATIAVCLFGFEMLKLKKVVGEVLKSNERIIKVDTRAGFCIVGEDKNNYLIEMTRDTIKLD